MILSILAGIMIGFGGIVNLMVGHLAGAIFFSFGLFTILNFKFSLFTGKAGLFPDNRIGIIDLIKIWVGNLIGTGIIAVICFNIPQNNTLIESAHKIIELRNQNLSIENILLGILCGILMYIAVTGYNKTNNIAFVIAPVTIFILCGFNHCVADMFYSYLGAYDIRGFFPLIPTTIGNFIGCCIIPYALKFN